VYVCAVWCWSVQGKEVLEYYINELLTEGIYHIPPWSELSESSVGDSVVGETASSSVCYGAAAATSLSVVASSSGPALLRAAISSSTMQLGASAGNIAIDSEGNSGILCHLSTCISDGNCNDSLLFTY